MSLLPSFRSTYFQQIEEDVQRYSKSIVELKKAITCFQTKDMVELIQFSKEVESVLEKLTDETQVRKTRRSLFTSSLTFL